MDEQRAPLELHRGISAQEEAYPSEHNHQYCLVGKCAWYNPSDELESPPSEYEGLMNQ